LANGTLVNIAASVPTIGCRAKFLFLKKKKGTSVNFGISKNSLKDDFFA
jgi:hypothetical protein